MRRSRECARATDRSVLAGFPLAITGKLRACDKVNRCRRTVSHSLRVHRLQGDAWLATMHSEWLRPRPEQHASARDQMRMTLRNCLCFDRFLDNIERQGKVDRSWAPREGCSNGPQCRPPSCRRASHETNVWWPGLSSALGQTPERPLPRPVPMDCHPSKAEPVFRFRWP